jgi:hypothetical protein
MSRRAAAWLLSVPLVLGATEAAHWLIYRLVYPNAYLRGQVLASSGHGYLRDVPALAALGAVAIVIAFVSRVLTHPGARSGDEPSCKLLIGLAPLAFALQECIEAAASGHSPLLAAYQPTFLPGVALALPLGFVAYALIRLLLGSAERLAALSLRGVLAGAVAVATAAPPMVSRVLRASVLSVGGCGERAPPAFAVGA